MPTCTSRWLWLFEVDVHSQWWAGAQPPPYLGAAAWDTAAASPVATVMRGGGSS